MTRSRPSTVGGAWAKTSRITGMNASTRATDSSYSMPPRLLRGRFPIGSTRLGLVPRRAGHQRPESGGAAALVGRGDLIQAVLPVRAVRQLVGPEGERDLRLRL